MHIRRILPFTLVELMIVIAIVTLIGGGLGISVLRMVQKERFKAGVELVLNKLRLSQEVMLIENADLSMRLSMDKDELYLWIETDDTLQKAIQNSIKQKFLIKQIKSISFTKSNGSVVEDAVTINFRSGTSDAGILRFSPEKNNVFPEDKIATIVLPGYPAPINQGTPEKEEWSPAKAAQITPREVLETH